MHAKNTKHVKVQTLLLKTYLEFAKNTAGSKLFQNYFAKVNGKEEEVTRKGKLSCAFHISSILKIFSLLGDIQITVHRTLDDMERSGWKKIKFPRPGCVVLWAAKPANEVRIKKDGKIYPAMVRHMGIYLGKNKAVSNRSDMGENHTPYIHPLRYRPIEAFYWHKKLEK